MPGNQCMAHINQSFCWSGKAGSLRLGGGHACRARAECITFDLATGNITVSDPRYLQRPEVSSAPATYLGTDMLRPSPCFLRQLAACQVIQCALAWMQFRVACAAAASLVHCLTFYLTPCFLNPCWCVSSPANNRHAIEAGSRTAPRSHQ